MRSINIVMNSVFALCLMPDVMLLVFIIIFIELYRLLLRTISSVDLIILRGILSICVVWSDHCVSYIISKIVWECVDAMQFFIYRPIEYVNFVKTKTRMLWQWAEDVTNVGHSWNFSHHGIKHQSHIDSPIDFQMIGKRKPMGTRDCLDLHLSWRLYVVLKQTQCHFFRRPNLQLMKCRAPVCVNHSRIIFSLYIISLS